MSCSVFLDGSGVIKNTYESQCDGLGLGGCQLAALSVSRLHSIFAVALRKSQGSSIATSGNLKANGPLGRYLGRSTKFNTFC